MKPYYIAVSVFAAVVVVVVSVTLFGNAALRHDYKIEKKIGEIQNSLQSYIATQRKLPEIPPDAGIDDMGSVEYKKVSDSRYVLCASFDSKSDGYTPVYIDPLFTDELTRGANLSADTKFTDGDRDGLKHDKGYTCFYYEPFQLKEENIRPYLICDVRYKSIVPQVSVTSVDAVKMQITGSSYSQNNTYDDNFGPTTRSSVSPVSTTKNYDVSKSKIVDRSCSPIDISQITAGDSLIMYYDALSSKPDLVKASRSAAR